MQIPTARAFLSAVTRASAATVVALGVLACDSSTPSPEPTTPERVEKAPPETLEDVLTEALEEMVADKDPYSRSRRLATLLPDAGPAGIPAVRELLDGGRFILGPAEIGLLLRFWASHEGYEASVWAATKTPLIYRNAAVLAALTTWAENDPKAAAVEVWDWPLKDQELQQVVPIALIRGWHASDEPEGIEPFLRAQVPGIFRQRGVWAYAGVLIEDSGVDAAMDWIEQLPDDDNNKGFKLDAFRRMASLLSARDLQAGVAFCERYCGTAYGTNIRSLVASAWVRKGDGAGAMEWLSTAPEGFERLVAVKGTFLEWMTADREAAFAWVEEHSADGPKKWLEGAYPLYAINSAYDSPTDAIERTALIEGDWKRETALVEIARIWRGRDEAAAEAWLLESGFTDKQLENARKPMKRFRAADPKE